MSVSNLTNGRKNATCCNQNCRQGRDCPNRQTTTISALSLAEQERLDLELAILGRIAALSHLIGRTRDIEDRENLDCAVDRMSALLKRLRDL